jgi:histidinol-phosphatase
MSAAGSSARNETALPALEAILADAERFARDAGALTLHHFGRRVSDEAKGDGSPVTIADREAELALRRWIEDCYPGHGILGEEFGASPGTLPVRWILDPIDGTRSFMRGVPLYGVLIGVEFGDEPMVGVAHFPALDETVSAARGLGCHWNGVRTEVNTVSTLAQSVLLTSDPRMSAESALCPGWEALVGTVDYSRSWGDAYGHALVATGRAELMVDPILSPWDAAPLSTILEEAGGRFTDLHGRPGIHGGSGISSNGLLHDKALGILRSGS